MNYFLVIQTAFIGDVILATGIVEKLHSYYPDSKIDILVRKGNESLLSDHPYLNNVLVWDKRSSKLKNLFRLSSRIKKNNYSHIINLHRFASSGFITWRSNAKHKLGFDKNPFSFCYTRSYEHQIGNGQHELDRNQGLISEITDNTSSKPVLYPSNKDFEEVKKYKGIVYYCIAPASVWFTKQVPLSKWKELIDLLNKDCKIYLLGSKEDKKICDNLKKENCINLAGKLSLLESAALMKDAKMNFVNDSAPLHMASAMDAPMRAFFCSTSPDFGFGPLSNNSLTIEAQPQPSCKPCGLHGHKTCPNNNFVCGEQLNMQESLK